MTLYSGGESSRIYAGTYRVHWWARWPADSPWPGEPEEGYTDPGEYEAAAFSCRTYGDGIGVELVAPDPASPGRSRPYHVHVERAVIEEMG